VKCTGKQDTEKDANPCVDGYCSTVQGLLDCFEVDLGFTELSFIQIDLCVLCVFVRHRERCISWAMRKTHMPQFSLWWDSPLDLAEYNCYYIYNS